MKPILLIKKLLGLVEMNSGLVNAISFSWPEWQALKLVSLHPVSCNISTPSQQMAAHIQITFLSSIVLSATEMINHLSTNYKNDVSFHANNESV